MKTTRHDASFFLLLLIVALLVGGGVSVLLMVRENPVETALSGDRILNTLIMVEHEGRPVVNFVLMYYPQTRRAALFDVPGNIGQIIPSIGRMDRIDTLFSSKNTQAYTREIASILGVEIPFSLTIGTANFSRLVDLLEGVDVFTPDAIADYSVKPITLIPPGTVTLDGSKALDLLLYENPEEDESLLHTRRQRLIVSLVKRISEKLDTLGSRAIRPVFLSLINTNVRNNTVMELLGIMVSIDTDRLIPQRVGGNLRTVSGEDLLFPFYDGSLIKDIVKQSLSALSRQGEGGVLERVHSVTVLNGTSNNGLARRTANLLQGFGYDTPSIGNADAPDQEKTLIIDHLGSEEAVSLFADVIRCTNIRTEIREESDRLSLDGGTDFTIIIGKDFNGRYVR